MSNLGVKISFRHWEDLVAGGSWSGDVPYWSVNEYCRRLIEGRSLERVGSENETSPCIFRASTALLKECADAYVPQIVSIGPYHGEKNEVWQTEIQRKQKRELWGMETFKDEAVSRVLVRILIKGWNPGDYDGWEDCTIERKMEVLSRPMFSTIVDRADEIRRCYDKEMSISEFSLVMMARDACFILEFFRCLFNDSVISDGNQESSFPDFKSNFNPVVRSEIMKDLVKLENQIPLFVLEQVLSMEFRVDLQEAKSRLQWLLKAVFHKFYYRPFDCVASGECPRQNHILDVYYHCCLGDEDDREKKQKREELQEENQKSKDLWVNLGNYVEDLKERKSERHKVPSAVELEKGGVKIQATGKTVQDIQFQGRSLYIPPVELISDSELFIGNLMALERCYDPEGSSRKLTAFVQFLNELCQTEKGAAVMRENGVIIGNLWQDSQVTRLFSSCLQSHSVPSYFPIEVTRTRLMKYYSRKSRIAAAEAWTEFRKTYFSKPWILIGGIGATIILILTAIQVFCLFHSCGAH